MESASFIVLADIRWCFFSCVMMSCTLIGCLLFSVVNFDIQFGHFVSQILPHLFTDTFAIVVLVSITVAAAATSAKKVKQKCSMEISRRETCLQTKDYKPYFKNKCK